VGRSAGARRCNQLSVRQSLRKQGGRRSAADRRERSERREQRGDEALKKRPGARLWAGGWALARLGWCCRRRGPQKERGGTGPRATRWGRNHGLGLSTSLRKSRRLSCFRGSPFRGISFRGGVSSLEHCLLGGLSQASELRRRADSGEERSVVSLAAAR